MIKMKNTKSEKIGELATIRNKLRYKAYFLDEDSSEALYLDKESKRIQRKINDVRCSSNLDDDSG